MTDTLLAGVDDESRSAQKADERHPVITRQLHGEALKVVLLALSTFFAAAVAVTAILAIVKLALGV